MNRLNLDLCSSALVKALNPIVPQLNSHERYLLPQNRIWCACISCMYDRHHNSEVVTSFLDPVQQLSFELAFRIKHNAIRGQWNQISSRGIKVFIASHILCLGIVAQYNMMLPALVVFVCFRSFSQLCRRLHGSCQEMVQRTCFISLKVLLEAEVDATQWFSMSLVGQECNLNSLQGANATIRLNPVTFVSHCSALAI